jgi:hypothetical protein
VTKIHLCLLKFWPHLPSKAQTSSCCRERGSYSLISKCGGADSKITSFPFFALPHSTGHWDSLVCSAANVSRPQGQPISSEHFACNYQQAISRLAEVPSYRDLDILRRFRLFWNPEIATLCCDQPQFLRPSCCTLHKLHQARTAIKGSQVPDSLSEYHILRAIRWSPFYLC